MIYYQVIINPNCLIKSRSMNIQIFSFNSSIVGNLHNAQTFITKGIHQTVLWVKGSMNKIYKHMINSLSLKQNFVKKGQKIHIFNYVKNIFLM